MAVVTVLLQLLLVTLLLLLLASCRCLANPAVVSSSSPPSLLGVLVSGDLTSGKTTSVFDAIRGLGSGFAGIYHRDAEDPSGFARACSITRAKVRAMDMHALMASQATRSVCNRHCTPSCCGARLALVWLQLVSGGSVLSAEEDPVPRALLKEALVRPQASSRGCRAMHEAFGLSAQWQRLDDQDGLGMETRTSWPTGPDPLGPDLTVSASASVWVALPGLYGDGGVHQSDGSGSVHTVQTRAHILAAKRADNGQVDGAEDPQDTTPAVIVRGVWQAAADRATRQ